MAGTGAVTRSEKSKGSKFMSQNKKRYTHFFRCFHLYIFFVFFCFKDSLLTSTTFFFTFVSIRLQHLQFVDFGRFCRQAIRQVLLQYALNLMTPGFTSCSAPHLHSCFTRFFEEKHEKQTLRHCGDVFFSNKPHQKNTETSFKFVRFFFSRNFLDVGCEGLVQLESYHCLFAVKCLHEWLPGSLAGIGMFVLRAANVKLPYISQVRFVTKGRGLKDVKGGFAKGFGQIRFAVMICP